MQEGRFWEDWSWRFSICFNCEGGERVKPMLIKGTTTLSDNSISRYRTQDLSKEGYETLNAGGDIEGRWWHDVVTEQIHDIPRWNWKLRAFRCKNTRIFQLFFVVSRLLFYKGGEHKRAKKTPIGRLLIGVNVASEIEEGRNYINASCMVAP